MNKPHVHAEIIKQWADGADIEFSYNGKIWSDIDNPVWHPNLQYRVKNIHQEVIDAHLKGAIIQYLCGGIWKDYINNLPMFSAHVQYRVKPEPKPDYSKFGGLSTDQHKKFHGLYGVYSKKEYVPNTDPDEQEFKLVNILELVFDGETDKLKQVIIHDKE